MRYFKFYWDENRGDEYSDWGNSFWYNEFDEEFYATKQMRIYDNGNVLKYDLERIDDEFGCLAEGIIDIGSESQEISKEEFEAVWNSHIALNYK